MIYECNDIVLKIYNSDFEVEYKDDKSPLTIADTKCNEYILQCIKKNRNTR